MKSARPSISKKHLSWKRDKKGVWIPYHRVSWSEDGKRRERSIKLDWQNDPQRLDELYWKCEAGRDVKQQPAPSKYTWRALITAWRVDPRIQGRLADSTKKKYRTYMDLILTKNAEKDVRDMSRKAVRKVHDSLADTPRKADWVLQIISLLWNYGARKLDWPLGPNPAEGIDHYGKQREYEPWPEWMIQALSTAPETVQLAAELILNTGQRPNAAISMEYSDIQGETMLVLDEKQDDKFPVYCPIQLRDFLDSVPQRGSHILAKNLSEPLGYDAVEKRFRAWRKTLPPKARKYTLHGLRKSAIIRLAEAGCSDAEIQAVTNQSAEMVAYYRRKASRLLLSRKAQKRRT